MKLGGSDISAIKIGGTDVSKVYIGTTEVWTAFTGLLDTYTGAAAAYSLRQLSSISSFAVKIRRDSDNLEQDIGFVDYQLDTSSIASFCSGANCFVSVWYDQSGNGYDASQGTAASQPKIYDSIGGIVAENGKPAVQFDGSDDELTNSSLIDIIDMTLISILNSNNTSQDSVAIQVSRQTQGHFSQGFGGVGTSDAFGTRSRDISIVSKGKNGVGASQLLAFQHGEISVSNTLYVNSIEETASIGARSTISNTNFVTIGSRGGTDYLNGNYAESIIYLSDQSSNRGGIEANINANYQIYWDGSQTSLLDSYGGGAAAYSLRALSSSYTGPLVEVRRSSDNAAIDIYARYDGTLNVDALESFCSGTDGYVATWYDQSGNSNDATQTTAASQPKIHDSVNGVIEENGRPSVQFDGSDDSLSFNLMTSFTDVTISLVLKNDTSNQDSVVIDYGLDNSNAYSIGFGNFGTANRIGSRSRVNGSNYYKGATINVNTQQRLVTLLGDSTTPTNSKFYLDSTLYTDNIGSRSNTTDSRLGSRGGGGNFYNGNMQEVIIYNSDQSSNRSGIETNINDFYNIY